MPEPINAAALNFCRELGERVAFMRSGQLGGAAYEKRSGCVYGNYIYGG
jgi:hypothetical protein